MNLMKSPGLLLTAFLPLLFLSCLKPSPPSWVAKISLNPPPPHAEEIFRLSDGGRLSFPQLMEELRGARVIFTGESHDQMEHHQIQRRIIRALVDQGKAVVIAMEMFQRPQQPLLDRWTKGLLSEEEFLRQIEWETTWGMDYRLYKGLLDEARDRGLKVLALNVPRELVRKAAQGGIDSLSEEERKGLPEMDLGHPLHRSYIESIYRGHEGGLAKDFERFYLAQVLWDEGMAETLSNFLSSPEGEGKTIVVIAGAGHIIYRFGIPERFFRRSPLPYKTILLREWGKEIQKDPMFSQISRPPADYLWLTHPSAPEKRRPRIGLVLKASETPGVLIERILPDSPAEKAGLLPGDRILRVNEQEILRLQDLHDAVTRTGSGKGILFLILREGKPMEISVSPHP
ncbi:MAG: ChaN family lipoprotein [Desulfobacterota bacterium]|nr:ChaN family lipoprotein [Thermodesulfobacteriota bacterium]